MVRRGGWKGKKEGRKQRSAYFRWGRTKLSLLAHVCKSGWPQVCDNLNLLAECWAYSPVQFGKVVVCEGPEFII